MKHIVCKFVSEKTNKRYVCDFYILGTYSLLYPRSHGDFMGLGQTVPSEVITLPRRRFQLP